MSLNQILSLKDTKPVYIVKKNNVYIYKKDKITQFKLLVFCRKHECERRFDSDTLARSIDEYQG